MKSIIDMLRHPIGVIFISLLLFNGDVGSVFASPLDAQLKSAIARAAPGAVIRIKPGVYTTRLVLKRSITLIGGHGVILNGGGQGDVIRVLASDVTVRGLTIINSGISLTTMDSGIYVSQSSRNVIIDHNVLNHVLFGIYLDGPSHVTVANNVITGINTLRRPDRGDGIHLWNDTHVVVRNNNVSETRDGIYIYVSPHNVISNNVIHDVRYGIHYMYSNHDRVDENYTYDTKAGYALMQSDHLHVMRNISDGDADYGMLLNYVTYSKFEGNVIKNVTGERDLGGNVIPGGEGKGLFVYNSELNIFYRNLIERCPIGIHVTAGSEQNHIYGNSFVNNRVQVKYVQNAKEEWSWKGVGNYWSDYLGWDLNHDGYGDVAYRPNDGVDILLWKYPDARLLMSSPAILVLRYVQRAFPVFTPPSVQDSHPLMDAPVIAEAHGKERHFERRH